MSQEASSSRLEKLLDSLDEFIEKTLKPIEASEGNERFFNHRREYERTDWEHHGLPRKEWEDLLAKTRSLARDAGFLDFALPKEFGGGDATNLEMAVVREHLAAKGIGLHCDLQNEHSIVGNFPTTLLFRDFGNEVQREIFIKGSIREKVAVGFGLTEPEHGSDATWMKTEAHRFDRNSESGWLINGEKMWTTGAHRATHLLIFARTSGKRGDPFGISCFVMPIDTAGFSIDEWLWTFNMPTDHPRVSLKDVWLPDGAVLGEIDKGLNVAQHFVHENRKPLSINQSIQFKVAELSIDYEMIKALTMTVAEEMDELSKIEVSKLLSAKVAMCNYRANSLACDAADYAMQVHGGIGYSRYKQFEHHYRHHRRYRITEGSDEIQLRKIAGELFGFIKS